MCATSASPPRSSTTCPEAAAPDARPKDKLRPGRDGPAQRPARPRPDPLGGRGARSDGDDQGRAPASSRACTASTTSRPARGASRLGEAFAVIPLVKKGLPEAKMAAVRARRACSASPRARLDRRHAAAAARPGGARRAGVADRRSPRRCSRCAAAELRLPRRRAQGDRRLRGRRRRRARRAEGARALRLAPDGADAGRRTSPGTLLLKRAVEPQPNAVTRRRSSPPPAGARWRSSPGPSATPTPPAREGAPETPGLRAPAAASARASPTSASWRWARAALAEILGVEDSNRGPTPRPKPGQARRYRIATSWERTQGLPPSVGPADLHGR